VASLKCTRHSMPKVQVQVQEQVLVLVQVLVQVLVLVPVSALMLSHLDYCNTVLVGLPASTMAPLQRVLNAAARLVLDLKPRDHVTPALRGIHWLPVV